MTVNSLYYQVKLECRPKSDQVRKIRRVPKLETQTENTSRQRLHVLVLLCTGLMGIWWVNPMQRKESAGKLMKTKLTQKPVWMSFLNFYLQWNFKTPDAYTRMPWFLHDHSFTMKDLIYLSNSENVPLLKYHSWHTLNVTKGIREKQVQRTNNGYYKLKETSNH